VRACCCCERAGGARGDKREGKAGGEGRGEPEALHIRRIQ